MKKRNTGLEIGLYALAMIFLFSAVLVKTTQQKDLSMGLGLIVLALIALSKVFRFYRQANATINTIWLVSIVVILLGATMYLYNWGLPTYYCLVGYSSIRLYLGLFVLS